MKMSLLKGLSAEKKKALREDFNAATLLRDQVVKVLDEKITNSYRSSIAEGGYENPNWAYKQADSCGYIRGLEEIKSILSQKP